MDAKINNIIKRLRDEIDKIYEADLHRDDVLHLTSAIIDQIAALENLRLKKVIFIKKEKTPNMRIEMVQPVWIEKIEK